jgi:hypothetical protein
MSNDRETVIDLNRVVKSRRRDHAREVATQRWRERLTRAGVPEASAAVISENRELFAISFGLGVGLGFLLMLGETADKGRTRECIERCKAKGED